MYDVETVRRDFPILAREVHGRPLVSLQDAKLLGQLEVHA